MRLTLLLLSLLLVSCTVQRTTLVNYVNPLVGTESKYEFSNGNTYPAVACPFGMTAWTPVTGEFGDGWIYQYQKDSLKGIKATHQPSPWIGDYGDFSIMPMTGEAVFAWKKRASSFSHDNETSQPHYYSVQLDRYDVLAEITPTMRCSYLRVTFPESGDPVLVIDTHKDGGMVEIFPKENKISGYTRSNRGGVPDNFACYFVIKFDTTFSFWGVWDGTQKHENKTSVKAQRVGAFVRFNPGMKVRFKIGTSFISRKQAELNLEREIGELDFITTRKRAKSRWNNMLEKIRLQGAKENQNITFYTAFYRTLLFPRVWYEWNAENKMIHFSPYDGHIHPGEMYADNGFWDTFRAVYPFFTILFPERDAEIIRGWINAYKEGGWFPKWTSPGYRNVMIGTHVESLIADAFYKGIRDYDLQAAYSGAKKDASVSSDIGRGRIGLDSYKRLGYVPYDRYDQATSRTLEFAYDDFCVARLADSLGSKQAAELFYNRSMNYKNVWDPSVGFMRGRKSSGEWKPEFSPIRWGNPFTEGSSWHYTWSVMHDIAGLIDVMGGRDAFCNKLDSLVSIDPDFKVGHYGHEIHEMTEMVACKMGQYAHGNQPVHHVLYLWNYGGQPWKSQRWVRRAAQTLYGPGPDGLCGDEDNGQMSAWYIFSALGFYPVCPGHPSYVIGSPLFKKATLYLPNGKTFQVIASNNSEKNVYIQSASINGEPLNKSWLGHEIISTGGTLKLEMGSKPNTQWASDPKAAPFSLSTSELIEN